MDEPIGTTGTLTQALTPDGDTIFEQTDYAYNDAGEMPLVTARQRLPDASGEGPLGNSTARTSYVGYWFDALGRQIASADYGALATSPTRTDTVPERSDSLLITTVVYNARGEAESTFNPDGHETRTEYDAAGRAKKVIQNPEPFNYDPDHNVTTEYGYNPQHLVSTIAVTAGGQSQETQYVYGTDVGGGTPDVYRNDLVRAVIYADSTNAFNPITRTISGDYDRVEYTYNRLGQVTSVKDQNETVHEYEFDGLGRQVADKVTLPEGSAIDPGVLRIERSYDVRGLLETVTSYSDPDGGSQYIVNQVKYEYNDWGQVVREYQEHDGPVDAQTPFIEYGYAGAANGLRLESVAYPNEREVHYEYGSNTADDYLNRVAEITDTDDSVLADYTYLGLDTIAKERFVEPGVKLDYTAAGAIDQFGRIVDQIWRNYTMNGETEVDGDPIDSYHYGFDRVGNRTSKENVVAGTQQTPVHLDELYHYDEIYRLIGTERGNLVNGVIQNSTLAQQWDLDGLGNMRTFNEGTAVNNWSLEQTRAANAGNEFDTDNDHSNQAGDAIGATTGTNWADPVYDAAGNMTSLPQPDDPENSFTCTYDAWNRLVKVEDGETTVERYIFDGTSRRIIRVEGSDYEHFFYAGRQLVETRNGTSTATPGQPTYQYVWSLRYTDSPVLRDANTDSDGLCDDGRVYYLTDANFNVTALVAQVSSTWQVVERYVYDPYGSVTVWDSTWTNIQSPTTYSNTVLYTGQEFDWATGLYYYEVGRVYDPRLATFITHDPVPAANLYTYCLNNPVNYVDPSGMLPVGQWVWDASVGAYRNPIMEEARANLQAIANRAPYRPRRAPRPSGLLAGYLYDFQAYYSPVGRVVDQRTGQVGVWLCGGGWVAPEHASASAMAGDAGSSVARGGKNMAVGAGVMVRETVYYARDVGALSVDSASTYFFDSPLGYEEWSQIGKSNQPTNPDFAANAARNALRTGAAAGTAGGSEILIGTVEYAQTGNADAYQQHMGGVAGGNLLSAATIKTIQSIRPREVLNPNLLSPEEQARVEFFNKPSTTIQKPGAFPTPEEYVRPWYPGDLLPEYGPWGSDGPPLFDGPPPPYNPRIGPFGPN